MSDDLTGLIIQNRYKLIEKLVEDTLAVKYIARELEENILCIVKILHPELAGDRSLLTRFQRESYILLHLNDQHCVKVIDHGSDHHLHFIVTEYIDGRDLKSHLLKSGPMEPLRALNYAEQAVEGLEAANKLGIVHRDIKPQNILITTKQLVKISEFGSAHNVEDSAITSSNEYIGTPYYSAPEQIENAHSADIRSDLYSVAAVLFEMLTGGPPFRGETIVDVLMEHMRTPVPSLCSLRQELPSDMDIFMRKAMAKLRSQRYSTPEEFIEALRHLQQRIKAMPLQKEAKSIQSQEVLDDTARGIKKIPQKQARLVVLSNGQIIPLASEVMVVGRQDPIIGNYPEINLADKTVGRRHACLRNRQGTFIVEDLNALNKTRLNGVTLTPHEESPLKDGDILRFGSIEVRFEQR